MELAEVILWIGASSFNRQSLHHIGDGLNPYQQAISIIGKTLAAFDEDNMIPCFGFGDGTFLWIWDFLFKMLVIFVYLNCWDKHFFHDLQHPHMIKMSSVSMKMRDFVMDLRKC